MALYQEMPISRKWEHQAPRGIFELSNFVSGVDVFQISSQVWTIVSSSCSKQDVMMPYSTQTSVRVELEYFRCSLAISRSHGSVV